MANDNQTALGMSIQRKKDRVLELKQQLLYSNSSGSTYESNINARIDELKDQITEDEKLLVVEKEQWLDGRESYSAVEDGKMMRETLQYFVENNMLSVVGEEKASETLKKLGR